MAGILSARLNPGAFDMSQFQVGRSGVLSGVPGLQPSPVDPSSFQAMSMPANGNFWQSYGDNGTQNFLGGLLRYDPAKDQGSAANGGDRLGMIGATLQDTAASLGGNPQSANHLRQQLADQIAQQQKQLGGQALQKLIAAKTPQDRQAAALEYAKYGGDLSSVGDALKFGQPTYRNHPEGEDVDQIDPFSGLVTNTIKGTPKPITPLVSGGMTSLDRAVTWKPIPGYVAQQNAISDARRAPPKAPAAGAIKIPHPSSMY